ncbi:MAG: prepilin-type N-terminal cleavage/methylation domain-containing protein [Verrucomicrobia bacterium]|nr:prepilin-type N-terminal cleavage/methylation domain-containing protein [Verrucomicrobiota bacterium]MDA1065382.1 prepilin-type N-terminal cleavage/methylation domain-containing protein [Verrucomicrobiota bacterium]
MKIDNKGFTILEVLVAVVIFAGAATVLVASYINILSNFEASRVKANFDEELAYVRSELQIISDVEEATDGREFDMGNGVQGIWYSEIEMTEIPNLFTVNLVVDMTDSEGEQQHLNQQFYLLRPSWGEPDEVDKARQDMQERMQDFREDQQFGWEYKEL